LEFSPESAADFAGFTLFQHEKFNFIFGKTSINGVATLIVDRNENGKTQLAAISIEDKKYLPVILKVVGKGRYYDFFYRFDGEKWQILVADADAANLSTQRAGGFMGACIGLYATSALVSAMPALEKMNNN
jgi:alpha-N-arabinofuranosidase